MFKALEDELPEVQKLALSHAQPRTRNAVLALLVVDARLAGIIQGSSEPLLAQVRLAWWRDTLTGSRKDWPKGDPLFDILREWRAPQRLVDLVDGWEWLLGAELDAKAIGEFAAGRSKAWSVLAHELGTTADPAPAARLWALADLAAHLPDPGDRALVVQMALNGPRTIPSERALKPLAILAGLGQRALEHGGGPLLQGPGAVLTALRLGMFGR